MRMIAALVAFLVMCSCSNRAADSEQQTVNPDQLTAKVTAKDLSNQRVMAFAEDGQGMMWIGTFRGLNVDNTHSIHQYFSTDSDDDLPDNQINSLFRDSKKRLWVATIRGVAAHNEQDKFSHALLDGESTYCKQVFEGKDGRVFLVSNGRLGLLDEKDFCFRTVNGDKGKPGRDYQHGFMDYAGRIWLCNKTGEIDILNGKNYSLEKTVNIGLPPVSFFRDVDKNLLYVGTVGGLRIIDISTQSLQPLPAALQAVGDIANGYISVIHKHKDNLLINMMSGLYVYNPRTGEIKHQSDNGFPFMAPRMINAMFTDSYGNLWIGTYDQGYTVIGDRGGFNSDRFLANKFRGQSVFSLAADNFGRMWIVTLPGGLYLYDTKTQQISEKQVAGSSMNPSNISTVFVDRDGNLWLMSLFGAAVSKCRYDGTTLRELKSYRIEAPLSISQDKEGNVWIGSGSGRVARIGVDDSEKSLSFPGTGSFVSAIQPMPNGEVWAAGLSNPIFSVNMDAGRLEEAKIKPERLTLVLPRPPFIPTQMYYDSFGILWIGTVSNGLLRYDVEADSLTRITGMPCTDIASIIEDQQGNIWVSSMYGLASIDRTSGSVKSYYTSDGIGGNQFYDRASCMLPDGTVAFGGTHGLTIFNPLDLRRPRKVPLIFDELMVHNQPVNPAEMPEVIDKELCLQPVVTLDHRQNGFGISFASLNYGRKEHYKYSYKLEGHDKYWIEPGNNEAYYANLAPGKYVFRVRAAAPNGENVQEISLEIHVLPAPWLSWWAITIYVIVALALGYFIYKGHDKYHRTLEEKRLAQREHEQERRINRINMSFFSNISHEFRTPLTMISGPIAQLQNSSNITGHERRLLDVVQRNIIRMLRLVNQIMDFNKLDNDTLRLQVEHVDVLTYLRHTVETFAVNAEEKGVVLRTRGTEGDFVTWIDTDKLDKITTNLLSNAMKVTPPGTGQIDVEFDVVDADAIAKMRIPESQRANLPKAASYMVFTVSDTGPGVPPEERERIFDRYYQLDDQSKGRSNGGTGIGLYYSRALARLHHGCLFVGPNPAVEGHGARFTLIIPVGEDVYSQKERIAATVMPQIAAMQTEKSPKLSEKEAAERPTLLVVDDDSEVIVYLKTLLSPHYNLLVSFNADNAFEQAQESLPDLILSDVIMPGTDGYDLCRKIKNDLQICHIPVILVTAKATMENQVEGLNTGADAYVTKPFDPKYLLALIKSQLSNRQKARKQLSEVTETSAIESDVLSGPDKAFMDELYQLMEEELNNSELDITLISNKLHISRTKLFYKIKALTGSTPAVFFKTYKLNRAAELILDGGLTMQEIAFMTGFGSQAHFSTSFKKQFGVSPTTYASKQ